MNSSILTDWRATLNRLRLGAAFLAVPVLAGFGAALAADVIQIFGGTPKSSTDECGLLFGLVVGLSILVFTLSRHKSLR